MRIQELSACLLASLTGELNKTCICWVGLKIRFFRGRKSEAFCMAIQHAVLVAILGAVLVSRSPKARHIRTSWPRSPHFLLNFCCGVSSDPYFLGGGGEKGLPHCRRIGFESLISKI